MSECNCPVRDGVMAWHCPECPALARPPVTDESKLNCIEAGPGKGLCDRCANGQVEICRYTMPVRACRYLDARLPIAPVTDEQTVQELMRLADEASKADAIAHEAFNHPAVGGEQKRRLNDAAIEARIALESALRAAIAKRSDAELLDAIKHIQKHGYTAGTDVDPLAELIAKRSKASEPHS